MQEISYLTSHISDLNKYAIIVAGGTGSRMQSIVPKQFLPLNGRPVMMHTIEAFAKSAYQPEIIVVLHQDYHKFWGELCDAHHFTLRHRLVKGGHTRFHSVLKGLDTINAADGLVAVHDAVRALTPVEVIDEAYEKATELGNAIVAVNSRDSIRRLSGDNSVALPRQEIYIVQTPQTFDLNVLRAAYQQPYDDHFTDDASVVERAGGKINLIEGDHTNIKITFPEDIAIAETIMANKKSGAY